MSHLARLENYHTKGTFKGLNYNVIYRVINAADYGIPQRRERVIIVGLRSDVNKEWSFPEPTHSYESLAMSQLKAIIGTGTEFQKRKDHPLFLTMARTLEL